MQPDKKTLIKLSLDKARQAFMSASMNVENAWFSDAQNRIYYAIFYSVLALSYLEEFKTSNHSELLGWFNKKFIYKEQLFDKEIAKIYKTAYKNRMLFDYTVYEEPEKTKLEEDLKSAKLFIETIEQYVLDKLQRN
ncbi:MAG: HEPN domain-containing protein [Cyanobacteriota bacterium]